VWQEQESGLDENIQSVLDLPIDGLQLENLLSDQSHHVRSGCQRPG